MATTVPSRTLSPPKFPRAISRPLSPSNFRSSLFSSIYTWSPWKPAGSDALGLEFTPMLWGTKQIADFKRLVKAGYARTALGFNEPDHSGQASLDPGYAAQVWRDNMEPLKNIGYRLISPAVTSAPAGKTWLKNFINACSGCHVDAIAVHWYGTDPQAFISYVQDFHNTFGKNIWVTEFACQNFSGGSQCDQNQVNNFMNTVTAWMDSTGYVERYFAFGIMHDMVGVNPLNQLMASNGQPTALGWNYLT
ncbi:glycoside hydrolase family 128 protein [Hebeloma cylindrosporum]|uniref:Glycoside hydrolase family 128 protein n=1 Tax=Hebeloma cylindrosporum TaxID=76867 RepID=A0A0C3CQ29_HEBCY|nr:glycoside hydrolase family 128 protein [Hebeloma cylindrosporum h7]